MLLASIGIAEFDATKLAGDASPRIYWRIGSGDQRLVLLDASGEDRGTFDSWVAIGEFLHAEGLCSPKIAAVDREHRVCIMQDLGAETMTQLLQHLPLEEELYGAATSVLIQLASIRLPSLIGKIQLPQLSVATFIEELRVFTDWFAPFILKRNLTSGECSAFLELWRCLLHEPCQSPPSLVHRDFHSGNLIPRSNPRFSGALGLIDFQDMATGPWLYDVVSLIEDVRREVRADIVASIRTRALHHAVSVLGHSEATFSRDLAVLGAQRSLRVLGVCVRLSERDGKMAYLADLPRIKRYLAAALEHPELKDAKRLMGLIF